MVIYDISDSVLSILSVIVFPTSIYRLLSMNQSFLVTGHMAMKKTVQVPDLKELKCSLGEIETNNYAPYKRTQFFEEKK